MEELLLKAVANIGVPAVLCLYVLFGVNKSNNKLTDAINELNMTLKDIPHRMDKLEDSLKELKFKAEAIHYEKHQDY